MSDLVGNPEDRFSQNEAHISNMSNQHTWPHAMGNRNLILVTVSEIGDRCQNLLDDPRSTSVYHKSLVVRKPVFGVSDQVRHKPGSAITGDG